MKAGRSVGVVFILLAGVVSSRAATEPSFLPIGEEPLRLAALQTDNVQATLIAPELANTVRSGGFNLLLDFKRVAG